MVDVIADVLVVDDHPMMRRALMQLLELEDDLNPIAEASSGRQAISMAQELQPDLIMMDLNMPEMDGIETIKRLRDVKCDSRILVFTVSDDQLDVQRALKSGADGYLLKDMEPQKLIEHIRKVLNGKTTVSEQLTDGLINAVKQDFEPDYELSDLTSREKDVLQQIALGCSNKIIARKLDIAESTVKVHVKRLLSKMNMKSRVEAAVWVVENKIFLSHYD